MFRLAVLFQAIENKEWEIVVTTCREDPFQAKVWHHRWEQKSEEEEELPNSKKELRWRVLPIHFCLLHGCTVDAFTAIMHAFPEGIQSDDDQGNFPIHLAFKCNSHDEIISLLLDEWPESIDKRNALKKIPFEMISKRSGRAWVREYRKLTQAAKSERLTSECQTLESEVQAFKSLIHDMEQQVNMNTDCVELSYDEFQGDVRVLQKTRNKSLVIES